MVPLGPSPKMSISAIQRQLQTLWPDLPAAQRPEQKDNTWSFSLGESEVVFARMPAPIPWSDLEPVCEASLLWKNPKQALKPHRSHLIVTLLYEASPVEQAKRLTQVLAAILGACEQALGVYWGTAGQVISSEIFRDFAKEFLPDEFPLMLWVNVRVGKNETGTSSGFTRGLAAFGLMELETEDSPEVPGDLHGRLVGLAGYLLENGPVIRDGDTVGGSADERIQIVYSKSSFGNEGKVMRLNYGASSRKPWWKFW